LGLFPRAVVLRAAACYGCQQFAVAPGQNKGFLQAEREPLPTKADRRNGALNQKESRPKTFEFRIYTVKRLSAAEQPFHLIMGAYISVIIEYMEQAKANIIPEDALVAPEAGKGKSRVEIKGNVNSIKPEGKKEIRLVCRVQFSVNGGFGIKPAQRGGKVNFLPFQGKCIMGIF